MTFLYFNGSDAMIRRLFSCLNAIQQKIPLDLCHSKLFVGFQKTKKKGNLVSCERKVKRKTERERNKKQTNYRTKNIRNKLHQLCRQDNTITIQTIRITYFDLFWRASWPVWILRISHVIINFWKILLAIKSTILWFPCESFDWSKLFRTPPEYATFLSSRPNWMAMRHRVSFYLYS